MELVLPVRPLCPSTTKQSFTDPSQSPMHKPVVSSTPHAAVERTGAGRRSWSSIVFADFTTGERLSRVIYLPALTGKAPAQPVNIATLGSCMAGMNIDSEVHPAVNTPHPLDTEVDEMDQTRRDMVRLFASDGHIDDNERNILDRFLDHYSDIAGYRTRERAADSFKRNGHSVLTRQRFADAGADLIDLDAERKSRPGANVVKFPTRQQAG